STSPSSRASACSCCSKILPRTRACESSSAVRSRRALCRIRVAIRRIVDQCLEGVAARGEMDLIADLALPVPATIICEMLGVPVEDRDRFTVWTAEATFGLASPIMPPEVIQQARAAGESLAAYFEELIERRRAHLT